MTFVRQKAIALFLTLLLAGFPASLSAQQEAPSKGPLVILVLVGEAAVNNIRSGAATVPVVEVRDGNYRPVEGAEVVFELPPVGPGGFFPGQALTQTIKTNFQGQAVATGFRPNHETGRFQIKVTATSGNQTGQAVINQTNSSSVFATEEQPKKFFRKRNLIILGLIGAGAGAGIYFALRNGSSSSGSSVLTLVPGPVTIGPPR